VADALCKPPSSHQGKRKRRKKERDLQVEDKNSCTNNANNISNKRNKTKYTKPILSFLELGAGCWSPTSSCQAAPGNPGLASAVDGNWTRQCTGQDLDQDCKQDKEQGPLQKPSMDEKSETFVIPQL